MKKRSKSSSKFISWQKDNITSRRNTIFHALLRSFNNRKTRLGALKEFTDWCMALAREIFESLTAPYRHSPKGLKAYAIAEANLNKGLRKIGV